MAACSCRDRRDGPRRCRGGLTLDGNGLVAPARRVKQTVVRTFLPTLILSCPVAGGATTFFAGRKPSPMAAVVSLSTVSGFGRVRSAVELRSDARGLPVVAYPSPESASGDGAILGVAGSIDREGPVRVFRDGRIVGTLADAGRERPDDAARRRGAAFGDPSIMQAEAVGAFGNSPLYLQ